MGCVCVGGGGVTQKYTINYCVGVHIDSVKVTVGLVNMWASLSTGTVVMLIEDIWSCLQSQQTRRGGRMSRAPASRAG